jgi:hypothetical protein
MRGILAGCLRLREPQGSLSDSLPDRSSPVSHYEAPFEFTGQLLRVTVDMHDDQKLDGEWLGAAEMARQ